MSDYMKKYTINMKSHADMVEGHGVLSAYKEQVRLVKEGNGKSQRWRGHYPLSYGEFWIFSHAPFGENEGENRRVCSFFAGNH